MQTTTLLALVCGFGAIAVWVLRVRAARSSKRAADAKKKRTAALRSAQNVETALKGRR